MSKNHAPPTVKKTKAELVVPFKGHTLTIPKGTRCTSRCCDGSNRMDGMLFVDDLSFIDKRQWPILHHDATHYGIDIKVEDCE
jgi:hypothetical protein